MRTIREIIAHHERRIPEIDQEIERLLNLDETKHVKTEDHDHWIAGWREDRQISRDTISYLKTLERLQGAAA